MNKKETICGQPGYNQITSCIEPKGHEGFHTYGPLPKREPKLSVELEEVKSLLIRSCPEWSPTGGFTTN